MLDIAPTTGRWRKADANVHLPGRPLYVALRGGRANQGITAMWHGYLAGLVLDDVDYGDPVYLSATAGLFTDTTPKANETQTVTITGGPGGGTFTLTFGGQTTAAIAYNASADVVQSALELLSTIGQGNVQVTGAAGGPYTVEFVAALAGTDVSALTATSSLTGGTAPGVTIGAGTTGVPGLFLGWVIPAWYTALGSDPDRILFLPGVGRI